MYTIRGSNVNEVFPIGIMMLHNDGILQQSQHGDTLEMDQPVSVMYDNPRERILFDQDRASNPFLNLFEALWIIQGRRDVGFLSRIVGRMANYSDDGKDYYGAYGFRMRHPIDQIAEAVARLKRNPNDRQVVLTIRKQIDMFYAGKDQPCNLLVSCKIRNGKLNVHVFNRSNDFIWGMTGTNVVQFSMLQEYMAGLIGVPVGTYHQTTDSMHVYTNEQWENLRNKRPTEGQDPYKLGLAKPYDMMQGCEDGKWDKDLASFFIRADSNGVPGYETPFFLAVVDPMWDAFLHYERFRTTKDNYHMECAIEYAQSMADCDWRAATVMWLENIANKVSP